MSNPNISTTTQLPNNPDSWAYTQGEVISTALTVCGALLACLGLVINVFIVRNKQFRRPPYIAALLDTICSVIGLVSSSYFSDTRYADCHLKNIITTMILNFSPIFICISLSFVAESAIVSQKGRQQFRMVNVTLILAQFISLVIRIALAQFSLTGTAQCKIVNAVENRLSQIIIHLLTVLGYSALFVASLRSKGLLNIPSQFNTTMQSASQPKLQLQTNATASKTNKGFIALAQSVISLALMVVLCSIALFFDVVLSEANSPLKINTFAYGVRSLFLAVLWLVNSQNVINMKGRSTMQGNQSMTANSPAPDRAIETFIQV